MADQIETFTFSSNWQTEAAYPYAAEAKNACSLFIDMAFYIIGGLDEIGTTMTRIVKFQNGVWSEAGNLNTARANFAAIWTGTKILVAGGEIELAIPIERCEQNGNGVFVCVELESLTGFEFSSSLRVNTGFCPV